MEKQCFHLPEILILFIFICFFSCTGNDFDPDINLTPEINIKQGDVTIENGTGEYNFGLKIADGDEGHTSGYTSFTIENTGIRDLILSDISLYAGNTGDFDLTNTATSPVVPAGFTSFIIRFDPLDIGHKTATVLVKNNDPDESNYTFFISGSTEARVHYDNGKTGDLFGYSAAVSQGYAVIGIPGNDEIAPDAGAAFVYTKTGITWEETQMLSAGDGMDSDTFGHAVSISGTTILIGAPYNDEMGDNAGAAYVFTYSGSAWEQTGKLVADDGEAGDLFGYAVALSGDFAFIGVPGALAGNGAAYVSTFDGANWSIPEKIIEPLPAPGDEFGYSIASEGNHALVGSPGNVDGTGAVHTYFHDGALWHHTGTITASSGASSDRFGTVLSVSGNVAFIGSPGNEGKGAGYIFSYNDPDWIETDKLSDDEGTTGDQFGFSGSLSGTCCIIGSYKKDENGPGSGAGFLYEYSGDTWGFVMKIVPPDGEIDDNFGYALSLSGNDGFIGAPYKEISGEQRGAVYIYGL